MRDNQPEGRFEAGAGDDTVFALYRLAGRDLFIDHVEAPPHLRGTGVAGALMEEILAYASARGLAVIPICGWAAHWLAGRERRRRQKPAISSAGSTEAAFRKGSA